MHGETGKEEFEKEVAFVIGEHTKVNYKEEGLQKLYLAVVDHIEDGTIYSLSLIVSAFDEFSAGIAVRNILGGKKQVRITVLRRVSALLEDFRDNYTGLKELTDELETR